MCKYNAIIIYNADAELDIIKIETLNQISLVNITHLIYNAELDIIKIEILNQIGPGTYTAWYNII